MSLPDFFAIIKRSDMQSGVSERFFKISVENPVVVDVANALAHYIERHIQLTLRAAKNDRACVIRSAATANSELRIPNSELKITYPLRA